MFVNALLILYDIYLNFCIFVFFQCHKPPTSGPAIPQQPTRGPRPQGALTQRQPVSYLCQPRLQELGDDDDPGGVTVVLHTPGRTSHYKLSHTTSRHTSETLQSIRSQKPTLGNRSLGSRTPPHQITLTHTLHSNRQTDLLVHAVQLIGLDVGGELREGPVQPQILQGVVWVRLYDWWTESQ